MWQTSMESDEKKYEEGKTGWLDCPLWSFGILGEIFNCIIRTVWLKAGGGGGKQIAIPVNHMDIMPSVTYNKEMNKKIC